MWKQVLHCTQKNHVGPTLGWVTRRLWWHCETHVANSARNTVCDYFVNNFLCTFFGFDKESSPGHIKVGSVQDYGLWSVDRACSFKVLACVNSNFFQWSSQCSAFDIVLSGKFVKWGCTILPTKQHANQIATSLNKTLQQFPLVAQRRWSLFIILLSRRTLVGA